MPFRIALSGLNAASADLRIIGNNVANASTTGYKKSRAEFADIFATSSLGTTANAIGAGVRVASVAQQFTQGNIGFTDNNLDLAISGQGFFMMEDNGVAVYSRAGSFGVDRDGFVVNSQQQRLIAFEADANGGITGARSELRLDTSDINPSATTRVNMGLNVNAADDVPLPPVTTSAITLGSTGPTQVLDTDDSPVTTGPFNVVDNFGNQASGQVVWTYTGGGNDWVADLQINSGAGFASVDTQTVTVGTDTSETFTWTPAGQSAIAVTANVAGLNQVTTGGGGTDLSATANGQVQGTFTINDTTSFNSSTSLTIYDSLGTDHLATTYFRKTGAPNTWEMYTFVDGSQVSGPDMLNFNNVGDLQSITPGVGSSVQNAILTLPAFTPTGSNNNVNPAAMTLEMNLADLNQYGSPFTVNTLSQDGFATGRLSGVDIADSGVITARFTNGQSRTLGQIALANFQNSQGLRQLGDTSWAETFESGAPLVGAPGSGSLGLIESGALEGSNVDLTEQLVGMITAQRNFQANAQVISTADTVTQTIINIR